MKKILIAYTSRTGNTEKMANYLAEGIRMVGNEVTIAKTSSLKKAENLSGFDGFLFGCATYHKDMTGGMKQFLFIAESAHLTGKVGGAFGPHTHSGEAAPMIFDNMQYVCKMDMIYLGPLSLTDMVVATDDGMKACHDYAKGLSEKF